MDHYKKYTETKTVTRCEFIKTTCDKCGEELPHEGSHDTREFYFGYNKGESYGDDGGYKKGWMVEDLCNSCIEWLKDMLIKNNVTLREIDQDW